MPGERGPLILDKVSHVIDEIQAEGQICGYVFFAFMPSGEGIETWAEYEGVCNPDHILKGLEHYGIIMRLKV